MVEQNSFDPFDANCYPTTEKIWNPDNLTCMITCVFCFEEVS